MDLRIYTRRWGHDDVYRVERTATGWTVNHIAIGGDCDKTGAPYLFENLDHDSVNYPKDLGRYMKYLWDKAEEDYLTEEQIQEQLNELGAWITKSETGSPGGIFRGYK